MNIPLIHLDDHLVVADKPAGLLSVPGRGPQNADCVSARIQVACPDAMIVHRLDMATSGLLVFGRGLAIQRRLSTAFAERRVEKTYLAIVAGVMDQDDGWIDLPLVADWPNRPRQKVDHTVGKRSLTHWKVVSRDTASLRTRVALRPITGRSHQLRVHLKAIGHPIVGDSLYADASTAAGAPRLLLHATALCLAHPLDGRPLELDSPCPF